MGKIKGWTKFKVEDKGKLITYKLIGEPEYYKDVRESHDILIYNQILNNKSIGWGVSSRMFGDKGFNTKKEAVDYAINYMRANPNG